MKSRIAALGAVCACVVLGASGMAGAQDDAPASTTIKDQGGFEFKANRYIKDKLRWNRDVYPVASGGTLTVKATVADAGPHTFTVVKKADLPKSFNCKVCESLGKAHGANPESEEPPKFMFLEDGTGSESAPDVDKPGDSAFIAPKQQVKLKVTAPKGSTLHFVCLIHPWMQAKVVTK